MTENTDYLLKKEKKYKDKNYRNIPLEIILKDFHFDMQSFASLFFWKAKISDYWSLKGNMGEI